MDGFGFCRLQSSQVTGLIGQITKTQQEIFRADGEGIFENGLGGEQGLARFALELEADSAVDHPHGHGHQEHHDADHRNQDFGLKTQPGEMQRTQHAG